MTSTDPHPRHSAAELHNEDVAHEHSDVDIRTILAFGAGMVVVVAVSFVLMWLMFRVLERQAAQNDPQLSPLAAPAGQEPPLPRLQTNEPEGLAKFRAEEAKSLEGYGWANEQAGVARMPIAEAKKLILQRGLPVRAGTPVNPRLGTNAPAMGESSGGRAIGAPPPPGATQKPTDGPPAGASHGENVVR
jgi:hypothetical protein